MTSIYHSVSSQYLLENISKMTIDPKIEQNHECLCAQVVLLVTSKEQTQLIFLCFLLGQVVRRLA